ncbi:MAG: hypothetical protein KBS74_04440 [Clostridiales bacterium]|nr:hypothetical protein [Candidatus Cacconaster stercorequi]
MKLGFEKGKATTLIISAELFMYGTVLIRADQTAEGLDLSYASIADGGEVCGQSEQSFQGESIQPIIQAIMDTDFPDQEDDETYVSWSLQIGDDDGHSLCEIDHGTWENDIIDGIVDCIESIVGPCEAVESMRELLEY